MISLFESYNGLFHFLFANQDDYYYTKSYIKMNFKTYLISNLIKSGYSNIYYFEEKSNGKLNLNSYNCDFVDLEKSSLLAENQMVEPEKKKHSFFSFSFGKKKTSVKDENLDNVTSNYDNNRASEKQMSYDDAPSYFMQLLQNFFKMKNIALVVPVGIFSDIYDGRIDCKENLKNDIVKTLCDLKSASSGNIILFTSSVNAEENNKYFLNNFYVRNIGKKEKSAMVFFNRELFPEIVNAYDGNLEDICKLTLVYDALKKCLGSRMIVWNTLSFDNVLNVVKYSFLRYVNKNPNEIFYPTGIYAYVIWQWYNNYEFHNKYSKLLKKLPQNVFGYNKVIEQIIGNLLLSYETLTEIIDKENISNGLYDVSLLKNRCYKANELEGCITTNKPDTEVGIIKYLKIFDKIVIENLENETCRDISYCLPKVISFFSEPSFHHFQNKGTLAFELILDDKNSQILNNAFKALEAQDDWKIYTEGVASLLGYIFVFCHSQAKEKVTDDQNNPLGTIIFNKYMDCLEFYLEEYRKPFHKDSDIEKFVSTFLDCMESKDKERIQNFNLFY